MSGIYIPHDKIPTKCMGCSFRDLEYGGDCVLMPSFDAATYEEQFEHCPFKEISHWIGTVPEHGDLIDRDALLNNKGVGTQIAGWGKMYHETVLEYAPTIIPADKEAKE